MFTCVLNITITDHDVMWYRLRRDHAYIMITTVEIKPTRRINYTVINETATTLTIHNAAMSFIGFYWVKTPNFTGCNVSLNVLKGICDNKVLLLHIHNYNSTYIMCLASLYLHIYLIRYDHVTNFYIFISKYL